MPKLTMCVAAIVLAGCASTGAWRSLRIDGSTEATFNESVARLDEQLPRTYHRRMLALALADIARTGAQNAAKTEGSEAAYTIEDYLADVDGLTYKGLIAIADESGMPVSSLYYSSGPALELQTASRYGDLPGPAPTFNANGKPAFNTWTTGWPDKGLGGDSTAATRPESR